MIRRLTIKGLRGFATDQHLDLAIPNGEPGSGLTVIVGPNNAGKSTAIEALRAFAGQEPPSFTQGRRNIAANDEVTITTELEDGRSRGLKSIAPGGSETRFEPPGNLPDFPSVFSLPSRRAFEPYFHKNEHARESYIRDQLRLQNQRQTVVGEFGGRLFRALLNKDDFNQVLRRVLDPVPDWIIDQADSGRYFLKFRNPHGAHSSEGVGEGIVNPMCGFS